VVLALSKVENAVEQKRTGPQGVGRGVAALKDEFRHVRGRFHHQQATTTAPRAVRCHSRSVPGEPSSLTPGHDSTPSSLMLAPFVRYTEAFSSFSLRNWRRDLNSITYLLTMTCGEWTCCSVEIADSLNLLVRSQHQPQITWCETNTCSPRVIAKSRF